MYTEVCPKTRVSRPSVHRSTSKFQVPTSNVQLPNVPRAILPPKLQLPNPPSICAPRRQEQPSSIPALKSEFRRVQVVRGARRALRKVGTGDRGIFHRENDRDVPPPSRPPVASCTGSPVRSPQALNERLCLGTGPRRVVDSGIDSPSQAVEGRAAAALRFATLFRPAHVPLRTPRPTLHGPSSSLE